jgi:NADP-dependent 3-hydroxy acid dehydrogenase YdfG
MMLHSRDGRALRGTHAAAGEDGLDVMWTSGDIADSEAVYDDIIRAHEHFGRLDAVFNVAGVAYPGSASSARPEHWRRSWDTNVMGYVNVARAVSPILISQRRGHVVNLSSVWAHAPSSTMAPYAVTKHAVQGLSASMALELRPHGVKVSTVVLDKVDTGFREHMPGAEVGTEQRALMLDPRTVAEFVVGLVETDARTNVSSIQLDAWRWR